MSSNGEDNLPRAEASMPLIRLQSKDHEEILDIIDKLRSEGIGKYVNLPQLIVCGDQSSGKSSVLEAISGLSFPSKDNVCTRFATELILRRAPETGVTASIHPDRDRPSTEQERLRSFKSPTLALDRFGDIVKNAEDVIGVGKDNILFSKDVLRVEVSGPEQPHLTLVDLPGLYHAADESQNAEGVDFVESLVLSYMRNTRSVVLAVISAKSDIALQKVTAFTRKVDPRGERTMGIITKPDTLPRGSDMERSFYDLARNKRVLFRLGWHVLKNRTFEERHLSLFQRNESESEFLAHGIWASLPRTAVGVDSLRPRLSTVLKDHILSQMPSFITETQSSFKETRSGLEKLGEARETLLDQRRYLLRSSERFVTLIGSSINGIYFDTFFGDAIEDTGYRRRLRAVVQNRLSDFADAMHTRGEYRKIVAHEDEMDNGEKCLLRKDFVEEVRQRMRRSRGRELPGTFNPLIIGDLFYLQSQPWETIVSQFTGELMADTRIATVSALQEVFDERSVEGLLNHVVNPRLTELEDDLGAKISELLQPQQGGHPITYNHYFIETIQQAREQHLRDSLTEKLKVFFGSHYPQDPSITSKMTFSMTSLIAALGSQSETDMERFACSEAIDCMLAYYKVAIKKFVDDFSNLAVEKRLLEPLRSIFGPRTVETMADEVVNDIACEDESTAIERKRLADKLSVLEKSLTQLHRLDRHHLTAPRNQPEDADVSEDETETKTSAVSDKNNGQTTNGAVDQIHASLSTSDTPFRESPIGETSGFIFTGTKDTTDDWPPNAVPVLSKKKKRHPSADIWEMGRPSS